MSNALAIASVTAVLKDLLNNGVIDHQLSGVVGEVTVSALPPDRVLLEGQAETSRLNLFLYQVTPNVAWRNHALPSRDPAGTRVSNPPLALDLHYLVTAYGASEFHAEILLGYALQLLHETPVLTRDAVRRTLAPASPVTGSLLPPPLNTLAASELADQVEQIRLTPQVLGTEEMSRLWAAIQSHYRLTAAYLASVVLIESHRPARTALPVASDKRRIYTVPFRFPHIERAIGADGPLAPIVSGSTLIIEGRDLQGDETTVNLDGVEISPPASDVAANRVRVPLTSPLPPGVHAGVKAVQVVHRIGMGEPAAPHRGQESNVAAFVLRPSIVNGPVIAAADVLDAASHLVVIDGTPVTFQAGRLRLVFDPRVGRDQRVILLLNEFNTAAGDVPHAYTFTAPPHNGLADGVDDTTSVEIAFANVVAGTYLVRVQVDGAESLLEQDGTGLFAIPRVSLP
jgi:hypothetical protein